MSPTSGICLNEFTDKEVKEIRATVSNYIICQDEIIIYRNGISKLSNSYDEAIRHNADEEKKVTIYQYVIAGLTGLFTIILILK